MREGRAFSNPLWSFGGKKKKKQMLVSVAEARMLRGHQLFPAPRFPQVALLGTMLRTTGPGRTGQDPIS